MRPLRVNDDTFKSDNGEDENLSTTIFSSYFQLLRGAVELCFVKTCALWEICLHFGARSFTSKDVNLRAAGVCSKSIEELAATLRRAALAVSVQAARGVPTRTDLPE